MKAPDKIFLLQTKKTGEIGCSWHENQLPSTVCENVEYVRKDTVTQIVREYLENWLDSYRIERLIDKIEEL